MSVDAEGELSLCPSRSGIAMRPARAPARGPAQRKTVTEAIKAASLKQLSAITVFACSKGGFPTVNRHLYQDELAHLGWADLQTLAAGKEDGERVLDAALQALVKNFPHVQCPSTHSLECMQHSAWDFSSRPSRMNLAFRTSWSGIQIVNVCPLQVYFGAAERYINEYHEVFRRALNGEAVTMLHEAREAWVSRLDPSLYYFYNRHACICLNYYP